MGEFQPPQGAWYKDPPLWRAMQGSYAVLHLCTLTSNMVDKLITAALVKVGECGQTGPSGACKQLFNHLCLVAALYPIA